MPRTETSHSRLWAGLCRGTSRLYDLVVRSGIGRALTGYRRVDSALAVGRRSFGRGRCRPMSPTRLRLVEAVEHSRLFAGVRALFHLLGTAPLSFYGFFGLAYGLVGVLLYFALPPVNAALAPTADHLIASAVLALLSIPLMVTATPLSDAMGRSRLLRAVLVHLMGIPDDRLTASRTKAPLYLPYVATVLGIVAGCGGVFLIHPLIIPGILVALGVCGMIFTYPETGVVLSTLMLPVIWFSRNTLYILAFLILMTWLSYGIKLLFLHRTIHADVLDFMVLLLGAVMLVLGLISPVGGKETVLRVLLLFVCLSDYFLIVNLMTTRAYIRRCLFGVGLAVVMVTVLAYLRLVPVDSLSWLEGSLGGNAIIRAFRGGIDRLSGLWAAQSELFLVLVFPWLYAYLLHTRRLFRRTIGLIFLGLDMVLILMTHSVSALVCIVAVTILFFLFMGPKWLARGLIALPVVGCGAAWTTYFFPFTDAMLTILSRSRHFKTQLSESLWQMVYDHPAGIGVGEAAFAAVYPAYAAPDLGAVSESGSMGFEFLLAYGWAGALLAIAVLALFFQKSLTCLTHTSSTRDRAVILGGMTSIVGMIIFGAVRSFITAPRAFFTVILVLAICSAYENILFDESDVLTAESVGSPTGDDRIYRHR